MDETIRDILASVGRPVDDITVQRQLVDWESQVNDALRAAGKADEASVRFGGNLPLHLLGWEERTRLMGEYRKIIGLDTVLNRLANRGSGQALDYLTEEGIPLNRNVEISNIWEGLNAEKDLGDRNAFGRFVPGESESLIGRIYSRINLQFAPNNRPTRTGNVFATGLLSDYFGVSSIPRVRELEKVPLTPNDIANKKVMTFDIESAGLRSSTIREVAWQTETIGSGRPPMTGEIIMRPAQGQRGLMAGPGGRLMNTEDWLAAQPGATSLRGKPLINPRSDKVIEELMPFVDAMRDADYIVGHNIESFDINAIFTELAGTDKYKRDPEFRKTLDDAFKDVSGKTIDTLRMARESSNLSGLRVADNLEGGRAYSIENLLLKTDLAKRIGIEDIAKEMGYDEASGTFTRGLHYGKVDTMITRGLWQHVGDLQQVDLQDSGLSESQAKIARLLDREIRRSAAITPITNIRDQWRATHPSVARRVLDGGSVNPIEQEILHQRRLRAPSAAMAARVEQGIPTRNLLGTFGGFDRLINRGEMEWDEFYDTGAKPATRDFLRYRNKLRDRGFGFSGLSYEERLFGTAMSDITSSVADQTTGHLARESLMSRFQAFDPENIQWVTGSEKVTLPHQVLQKADLLRTGTLLDLSVVQATGRTGLPSINLAYKFESMDDIDKVVQVMSDMDKGGIEAFAEVMGMEPDSQRTRSAYANFQKYLHETDTKKNTVEVLRRSGQRRGVAMGQIFGEGLGDTVERVRRLLRAYNISDVDLADDARMGMRLPFASAQDGILRTIGAVHERGLLAAEKADIIPRNVVLMQNLLEPPTEALPGASAPRGLLGMPGSAGIVDRAPTSASATRALNAIDTVTNRVLPNLPKFTVGAIAAGLGMFMLGKKRQNDKYDAAFDYVEPEPGPSRYALADVLETRMAAGENNYRRQIDPLATASLTDHLYYSSIGHTNTSWDRNSTLYGGVL